MHISHKIKDELETVLIVILTLAVFMVGGFFVNERAVKNKLLGKSSLLETLQSDFDKQKEDFEHLKNEDQVKKNLELENEIVEINKSYKTAVSVYEDLLDLNLAFNVTDDVNKDFSTILSLLSQRKYTEANEKIAVVTKNISAEKEKQFASQTTTFEKENVPQNNTPPGSGYARQTIQTEAGSFTVSLIAADYGSTRVVVDTASDATCTDNCPVMPLSDYISRNGAFAGVNGSYFCPADYPSCNGKTNSFDLLVMNKNKVYFNSDNNVYSANPGVIFGGSYIRFVGAVSEWGRETGIDSMISNYPLLLSGGNVAFGGDSDPKKGSKGNRSFVAQKGNSVYIGVVHAATVAESALTLKALGMENALNLDDGGSTALWSGGYKVGPGRNLPNAILFVAR